VVSFYPGPSRVYDGIPQYVAAAHRQGVLSMNHRSDEFVVLCKQTVKLLRDKLRIPTAYEIFFTTSATECWETIAQSVIERESIHIYNGAFGEKWFEYTKKLKPNARAINFSRESILDPNTLKFDTGDLICITQNETSNGTQVKDELIRAIKTNNPEHLLAVDATSSMAGIVLDFELADIWYASVQKCFGLPAGLALMICSPRAIARIEKLGERNHYNSLMFVREMMNKHQTNCTPNVLGIYLLMCVLKKLPTITKVENTIRARSASWEKFFLKSKQLSFLVSNTETRSYTVMAISGAEDHIRLLKEKARQRGFLLGEGYGDLKKTSFRIANFPALKQAEIRALMKFLTPYL
jgi:phosphoserine aminotransferase